MPSAVHLFRIVCKFWHSSIPVWIPDKRPDGAGPAARSAAALSSICWKQGMRGLFGVRAFASFSAQSASALVNLFNAVLGIKPQADNETAAMIATI